MVDIKVYRLLGLKMGFYSTRRSREGGLLTSIISSRESNPITPAR